jgi:chromosome partitioning protein
VAQRAGVQLAILDTPGRAADAAIAAARAADLVLCPFRPSILDLETVTAVRDLLATAGNPRTVAVINAAPPRGGRHTEAEQGLTDQGFEVSPVAWGQRAAFGDAPNAGLAVREFEPGGKAAAEVLELYRFTIKLLNQ